MICRAWTFRVAGSTIVVAADRPFVLEPLFTRDPRHIGPSANPEGDDGDPRHLRTPQVTSLNHGIGFDTAAIELLLPTYGEKLGLKGKICPALGAQSAPDLIPAIESGWVESIHCFGGESGMNGYVRGPARRLLHRRRRIAALQPSARASSPASTRSTCSSAPRCRSM